MKTDSDNRFLPWIICISAGLFFFYEFFQLNLFDVINQDLRTSFAINAAELSWMSSACIWANVIFLLPAGIMLDHFAAKKVILIALLICVLGTFGFAVTNSYAMATFYHSLAGIGNAFCFLACVVLVSRWFPPKRQALVIGLIVTMAFLGGMGAHTPLAYLNSNFGWRNAVLISGLFGLVILAWIAFFVQDKPAATNNRLSDTNWSTKFKKSIRNKQTWLAGLYTSCLNLPIMVLCALWGGSYLVDVHGLSPITASNVVSLIFFGSIIGCPLLGFISDKHGKRKPTMLFGAVFSLLLVLPLVMNITLSATTLSIIFLALGFVTSSQVISYPLITESNHPSNTGVATGLASILIMSGGGFGQVIFGNIMASGATQAHSISNYQNAMLIFPISALIALAAILLIQETNCSFTKFKS